MKKIILQTAAILLILAGMMIACGKEETQSLDLGMYVETYPTQGRTRINLIDGEKLVIIKDEGMQQDEFKYEIDGNTIKLIDIIYQVNIVLYFHRVSNTEFKIENLYPNIPEAPASYMIFKK
ncbi:MAG: hypothetical protein LBF01_01040 [Bacteroidales bacterium]|nr:hypothetical protein [Bacteroidales bacterium]